MSKKKKIIISAICVSVILIGIILTVILVNLKRFSPYTKNEVSYNRHTTMTASGYGTSYHTTNSAMYQNGTQVIQDNLGKYGLYSWKTNEVLIACEYDSITCVKHKTESNKSYFQLVDNDRPNQLKLVDETGALVTSLTYDATEAKTFTHIMKKNVKVKESWGNYEASTSKRSEEEKVYISSYTFQSEYIGEDYHYELWRVTTTDGETFSNIYDMKEDRKLIQTMGVEAGMPYELNNPMLLVLSNGDIRFFNVKTTTSNDEIKSYTYSIYDVNYNLKNETTINASTIKNATASGILVGDNMLIQTKEASTEKDFDFSETTVDGVHYYNYTTYKINLKSGKLSHIKLDYLINEESTKKATVLNQNTTILDVTEIEDKRLGNTTFIAINNRFQIKEIGFAIDKITKVTDDRYIAEADNGTYGNDYNLIDDNYNLICNLGDIDSYFTTNESIIVEDNSKTYILDMDGLVVKTYDSSDIINIYNDTYYMVKVTSVDDGRTKTEYYLERLSERQSTPIYSKVDTEPAYISGKDTYAKVELLYNESFSLVIKVTKVAEANYKYDFYNYDGDLLLTVSMVADTAKTVTQYDSTSIGDDYVVVSFDGKGFVLDR
ncbi:MAG: hypothetical protein E7354_03715 [Clostridiales bacterium]|nr:hypothetical protein [Clostridiales bacterium]